jgi:hypothetical protein
MLPSTITPTLNANRVLLCVAVCVPYIMCIKIHIINLYYKDKNSKIARARPRTQALCLPPVLAAGDGLCSACVGS